MSPRESCWNSQLGRAPPKLCAPGRAASGSRSFASCAEARAAGAAPVRRGDPGYAPRLDRDNDGVGCE
ncbi:excalibur calcium-binding domain-containing protein [Mizugakiibacter sediminis]|uniref:excalibur calcium-binding domain-containing protein n=1 Tax=Mizugakiibacter sediminis TaxID=1475481 RepID=UPI0031B86608